MLKLREYATAGIALIFWAGAFYLSTRDSIPLGQTLALATGFLFFVTYTGFRFTASASDARSDGKEAVIYFIGYGLIVLITLFSLANLVLALLGYYLNPRLVGFGVSALSLFVAPFTVLIFLSCRHSDGILPRIISPLIAICSVLLCRMFYR